MLPCFNMSFFFFFLEHSFTPAPVVERWDGPTHLEDGGCTRTSTVISYCSDSMSKVFFPQELSFFLHFSSECTLHILFL